MNCTVRYAHCDQRGVSAVGVLKICPDAHYIREHADTVPAYTPRGVGGVSKV